MIMHTNILQDQEKTKIDEELSLLGLQPSDTDDNTSLRNTVTENRTNIDTDTL